MSCSSCDLELPPFHFSCSKCDVPLCVKCSTDEFILCNTCNILADTEIAFQTCDKCDASSTYSVICGCSRIINYCTYHRHICIECSDVICDSCIILCNKCGTKCSTCFCTTSNKYLRKCGFCDRVFCDKSNCTKQIHYHKNIYVCNHHFCKCNVKYHIQIKETKVCDSDVIRINQFQCQYKDCNNYVCQNMTISLHMWDMKHLSVEYRIKSYESHKMDVKYMRCHSHIRLCFLCFNQFPQETDRTRIIRLTIPTCDLCFDSILTLFMCINRYISSIPRDLRVMLIRYIMKAIVKYNVRNKSHLETCLDRVKKVTFRGYN